MHSPPARSKSSPTTHALKSAAAASQRPSATATRSRGRHHPARTTAHKRYITTRGRSAAGRLGPPCRLSAGRHTMVRQRPRPPTAMLHDTVKVGQAAASRGSQAFGWSNFHPSATAADLSQDVGKLPHPHGRQLRHPRQRFQGLPPLSRSATAAGRRAGTTTLPRAPPAHAKPEASRAGHAPPGPQLAKRRAAAASPDGPCVGAPDVPPLPPGGGVGGVQVPLFSFGGGHPGPLSLSVTVHAPFSSPAAILQ